jgi:hypothetical protein
MFCCCGGQRDELLALHEQVALHAHDGGERPAGAALALVLDRGHGAQRGPVDGRGGGGGRCVRLPAGGVGHVS